jgi:signal peptidase I
MADSSTSAAAAAPASAPAAKAQSQAPSRPPPESSVKETIESILIAFVLAFIFRAFVVEAFVIPTGSMAPTLMGAHMRFRCPDCGYSFEANYNARNGPGDDLTIPSRAMDLREEQDMNGNRRQVWVDHVYRDVRCPNCAYLFPHQTGPEVNYGDRILVLKYLYLFQEPNRWDVVVFKSPDDVPAYQQNYIKRLVGKPGETIMILDGDIYAGTGDDRTKFTIQTKPRYAQEALWRIIYDNDYYPRGMSRYGYEPWHQPWTATNGSGWDVGDSQQSGRVFRFKNDSGAASLIFNPQATQTHQGFTDWLAYDVEPPAYAPSNVSDLKLHFFYDRQVGDGPLRLRMTKGEDAFIAELTPGQAKLFKENAGTAALIGQATIPSGRGPLEVELTNVDYRVTLRVGGRDLIQTTPEQYRPNIPALLARFERQQSAPVPTVQITAEKQQATFAHLSLWRDVYYINNGRKRSGELFSASPNNLMHLGPDEFFVLGDNSLISGDARYWEKPIDLWWEDLHVESARVPRRFLLGKAFFVYWPAGFRPFSGSPPLAPDFGDMRFIR